MKKGTSDGRVHALLTCLAFPVFSCASKTRFCCLCAHTFSCTRILKTLLTCETSVPGLVDVLAVLCIASDQWLEHSSGSQFDERGIRDQSLSFPPLWKPEMRNVMMLIPAVAPIRFKRQVATHFSHKLERFQLTSTILFRCGRSQIISFFSVAHMRVAKLHVGVDNVSLIGHVAFRSLTKVFVVCPCDVTLLLIFSAFAEP